MRVRDDAWAWAGNLLLTATVGRGWVLLAGLLGILLITNLTAFALLIALRKSHGRGELKIKTPISNHYRSNLGPKGNSTLDPAAQKCQEPTVVS